MEIEFNRDAVRDLCTSTRRMIGTIAKTSARGSLRVQSVILKHKREAISDTVLNLEVEVSLKLRTAVQRINSRKLRREVDAWRFEGRSMRQVNRRPGDCGS